jgi:hypothetical protein
VGSVASMHNFGTRSNERVSASGRWPVECASSRRRTARAMAIIVRLRDPPYAFILETSLFLGLRPASPANHSASAASRTMIRSFALGGADKQRLDQPAGVPWRSAGRPRRAGRGC